MRWIEQWRLAMDPLSSTPVEKGSGDQSSSSNCQRRSQRRAERLNTLTVLGKVRVSKSTPKGQNIRTRTSKATICKPISAVTIQSSTQHMPKRREIKPRRPKEKALGQFLPQRVAKANRFADTGTKSRSRAQCSGDGQIQDRARPQRRSATQRLHPTPRPIKTRSQRISREPVRWAPE